MTGPVELPAGLTPGGRFRDWSPARVRYVVCDVDGTLVGPYHHATDQVVAAVGRAQQAGIRVGFATGRMADAVAALDRQVGAQGPDVLHNGGEVRLDGRTIAAWSLTPDQVDLLLAIAGERDDLYVEIYGDTGYHVSSLDERARPHWELLDAEPLGVVQRASELGDGPIRKATFALFDPAALDWLTARLADADVALQSAGSPRTPELLYTNVIHPDVDKGVAVTAAADHIGVPLEAVAAIGDAANDLAMLAVVGTAIAMGQADHEVQERAHLIVPAVEADGVAAALDALVAWAADTGSADA